MKKILFTVLIWVVLLNANLFDDLGVKLSSSKAKVEARFPNLVKSPRPNEYGVIEPIVVGNITYNMLVVTIKEDKVVQINLYKYNPEFKDIVQIYNIFVQEFGQPDAHSSVDGCLWTDSTVALGLLLQPGKKPYVCIVASYRNNE